MPISEVIVEAFVNNRNGPDKTSFPDIFFKCVDFAQASGVGEIKQWMLNICTSGAKGQAINYLRRMLNAQSKKEGETFITNTQKILFLKQCKDETTAFCSEEFDFFPELDIAKVTKGARAFAQYYQTMAVPASL